MFFSKLFNKKEEAKTELEEFSSCLASDSIALSMKAKAPRNLRIASGISTLVLLESANFVFGLRKLISGMPEKQRKEVKPLTFDSLMVETVAYLNFILSRQSAMDKYASEPESGDILDLAENLSQILLRKYGQLHNSSLSEISKEYGNAVAQKADVIAVFSGNISEKIAGNKMFIELAIASYSPIFHKTHITSMLNIVANIFDSSSQLLNELDQQR